MFGSAKKVDNLLAVVDYNGKQIDGPTSKVLDLGDLKKKFEAFNWKVIEMYGNDIADVIDGMNRARSETGKGLPVIVIMRTHMGFGVDFMLDNHSWHGVAPNNEKAAIALSQLEETLGDY